MNFTHTAKPVKVRAIEIVSIDNEAHNNGYDVALRDGTNSIITEEMTARYFPIEGDYLVTQEDGYVYINPKEVFERKYSPLFVGECK